MQEEVAAGKSRRSNKDGGAAKQSARRANGLLDTSVDAMMLVVVGGPDEPLCPLPLSTWPVALFGFSVTDDADAFRNAVSSRQSRLIVRGQEADDAASELEHGLKGACGCVWKT